MRRRFASASFRMPISHAIKDRNRGRRAPLHSRTKRQRCRASPAKFGGNLTCSLFYSFDDNPNAHFPVRATGERGSYSIVMNRVRHFQCGGKMTIQATENLWCLLWLAIKRKQIQIPLTFFTKEMAPVNLGGRPGPNSGGTGFARTFTQTRGRT